MKHLLGDNGKLYKNKRLGAPLGTSERISFPYSQKYMKEDELPYSPRAPRCTHPPSSISAGTFHLEKNAVCLLEFVFVSSYLLS